MGDRKCKLSKLYHMKKTHNALRFSLSLLLLKAIFQFDSICLGVK